jgi:manganese transport protein
MSAAKALPEAAEPKPKGLLRKMLPYFGPAFIASVAYIDPGNYATNIQAGSEFGYTLLWVIFASNLIAILVQSMAAKLGIATGKNLAEECRAHYPKWANYSLWIMMEIVAIATDLAEFLGAAIGLELLFGMPLWLGGIVTAIATFLILGLERYGFRPLEAVITGFVAVVALSYLVETFLDKPDWAALAASFAPPRLPGAEGALLAAGILGATVMPHAIFLHSALTQNRMRPADGKGLKRLFHFELVDVFVAMGVASFVNAAMLVMAAATFNRNGLHNVATLQGAFVTLEPLLGKGASVVFGVSLLASGLSSSTVGTSAGQIIMQGFIDKHIPVWLRRLITVAPSLLIIAAGFEPTRVLVLSQVLLSFGLPATIFSLLRFTADKKLMGELANSKVENILLGAAAVLVTLLNVFLIVKTVG